MKIQSINQQNNNNTSFKAILYPDKYSELLEYHIRKQMPKMYVTSNPKYIETEGKGLFTLVKKYLKGNQSKYIAREDNKYSVGAHAYDDYNSIRSIFRNEGNKSIPAVEEEKAIVKGMKKQLLKMSGIKKMSDEGFFQKFGIKYFDRRGFGDF